MITPRKATGRTPVPARESPADGVTGGHGRARGHPFANGSDGFGGQLALRRHLDLAFVTESLDDDAFFGLGRRAEYAHGCGFFNGRRRAQIEAAALQFGVVAALALFSEKRAGVLLEEFQLGGSLRTSDCSEYEEDGKGRPHLTTYYDAIGRQS